MKRRDFLKKIAGGVVAAAAAPIVVPEPEIEPCIILSMTEETTLLGVEVQRKFLIPDTDAMQKAFVEGFFFGKPIPDELIYDPPRDSVV